MIKNDLIKQIHSFWENDFIVQWDKLEIYINKTIEQIEIALNDSRNKYYERNGFKNYNSVMYCLFLYRLAHNIGTSANGNENMVILADQIYYLNKIMNNIDWYWGIALPEHIMCEHPIGTVLGRAEYGDYLFVYQECTIGGSRRNGELFYPVIGNKVLMYANSSIIGDCHIGNNVILAADTKIINRDVPNDTLVFGAGKDVVYKPLSTKQKEELFGAIWK